MKMRIYVGCKLYIVAWRRECLFPPFLFHSSALLPLGSADEPPAKFRTKPSQSVLELCGLSQPGGGRVLKSLLGIPAIPVGLVRDNTMSTKFLASICFPWQLPSTSIRLIFL